MQDNNAGSFKVILKGSLNVGVSLEEAKHNLSRLFGITPDQANSFLEGRPTIIKNNLDAERADRYRQVLTQAGVDFEIIEEAPALSLVEDPENEVATDAPTALSVCPKCGYRAQGRDDPLLTKYNGLGECPRCGVIPGNYRKTPEERKQPTADRRRLRPTEKASNSGLGKLIFGVVIVGTLAIVWPLLMPRLKSFSANPAADDAARQQTEQRLAYLLTVMEQAEDLGCEIPSVQMLIKSDPDSFQPEVSSLAREGKLFQDGWGRPMRCSEQAGNQFRIRSAGPDGVMDTADDITQEDLLARAEQPTAVPRNAAQAQVAGYASIKQLEQIIGEFSKEVGNIRSLEDPLTPRLAAAETALAAITNSLSGTADADVTARYQRCRDKLQRYSADMKERNNMWEQKGAMNKQLQELEETHQKEMEKLNRQLEKVPPDSDLAQLIINARGELGGRLMLVKQSILEARSRIIMPPLPLGAEVEIAQCYIR